MVKILVIVTGLVLLVAASVSFWASLELRETELTSIEIPAPESVVTVSLAYDPRSILEVKAAGGQRWIPRTDVDTTSVEYRELITDLVVNVLHSSVDDEALERTHDWVLAHNLAHVSNTTWEQMEVIRDACYASVLPVYVDQRKDGPVYVYSSSYRNTTTMYRVPITGSCVNFFSYASYRYCLQDSWRLYFKFHFTEQVKEYLMAVWNFVKMCVGSVFSWVESQFIFAPSIISTVFMLVCVFVIAMWYNYSQWVIIVCFFIVASHTIYFRRKYVKNYRERNQAEVRREYLQDRPQTSERDAELAKIAGYLNSQRAYLEHIPRSEQISFMTILFRCAIWCFILCGKSTHIFAILAVCVCFKQAFVYNLFAGSWYWFGRVLESKPVSFVSGGVFNVDEKVVDLASRMGVPVQSILTAEERGIPPPLGNLAQATTTTTTTVAIPPPLNIQVTPRVHHTPRKSTKTETGRQVTLPVITSTSNFEASVPPEEVAKLKRIQDSLRLTAELLAYDFSLEQVPVLATNCVLAEVLKKSKRREPEGKSPKLKAALNRRLQHLSRAKVSNARNRQQLIRARRAGRRVPCEVYDVLLNNVRRDIGTTSGDEFKQAMEQQIAAYLAEQDGDDLNGYIEHLDQWDDYYNDEIEQIERDLDDYWDTPDDWTDDDAEISRLDTISAEDERDYWRDMSPDNRESVGHPCYCCDFLRELRDSRPTFKPPKELTEDQRTIRQLTQQVALLVRRISEMESLGGKTRDPPPSGLVEKRPPKPKPAETDTVVPSAPESFQVENPPFDTFTDSVVTLLAPSGEPVNSGIIIRGGIMTTAHAKEHYAQVRTHLGAFLPLPKITPHQLGPDLIWFPYVFKKEHQVKTIPLQALAVPTASTRVGIVDPINKILSSGFVSQVDQGTCKYDLSTTLGSCGAPVVTAKDGQKPSMIVAVHHADREGCAITSKVIEFFRGPPVLTVNVQTKGASSSSSASSAISAPATKAGSGSAGGGTPTGVPAASN